MATPTTIAKLSQGRPPKPPSTRAPSPTYTTTGRTGLTEAQMLSLSVTAQKRRNMDKQINDLSSTIGHDGGFMQQMMILDDRRKADMEEREYMRRAEERRRQEDREEREEKWRREDKQREEAREERERRRQEEREEREEAPRRA